MKPNIWPCSLLDEPTVYWEPPVRDGLGGYKWSYPEEILCRWQYATSSRGPALNYTTDGVGWEPNTLVWVSTEVEIGGYLWKGTIEELGSIYNAVPSFKLPESNTEQIKDIASQVIYITEIRSIPRKDVKIMKAFLQ